MDAFNSSYEEIWVVDFEYRDYEERKITAVCVVALELNSGKLIRYFGDEIPSTAPYRTDEKSLYVGFYISGDIRCHLALGWNLPKQAIDIYPEFKILTNPFRLEDGKGLIGALTYFGLNSGSLQNKDFMRNKILTGDYLGKDDQFACLDYCEEDVRSTAALLREFFKRGLLNTHSLLRGSYMVALGIVENQGIPVDAPLVRAIQENRTLISEDVIKELDTLGVYEGPSFRTCNFETVITGMDIKWPRHLSGALDLRKETFGEMCLRYPELTGIHECRKLQSQLRSNNLPVGSDQRNRFLSSPFGTLTGRNNPKSSSSILALPSWNRFLIRPEAGTILIYADWHAQEFGIAAYLSGDKGMIRAYESGDPYLKFATDAGLAPPGATKRTHGLERELAKKVILGTQYGMGEETLAVRLGKPKVFAREILKKHRELYPQFWEWIEAVVNCALINRTLSSRLGWAVSVGSVYKEKTFSNFPMQANGAEMLRVSTILGINVGVNICGTLHDAILVETPEQDLNETVVKTKACLDGASSALLNGAILRTDIKVTKYPDRLGDPRGQCTWEAMLKILARRGYYL